MTHNGSRPKVLLVSVRSLDEALTQAILADSIAACVDLVVAGHESHKDAFGDVTFVALPEDKLANMHSALVDAVKKHNPQLILAPRTLYLEAYCLSEAFSLPIAFLCRVPVAPTASYMDPLWRASCCRLPIGFLNRASFQAVPFAVHNILKQHAPLVDSFRKLLALPPVTSRLGLLGQVYLKNVPSLCLWSPTLVPVHDLPSVFEVVGPSLPPSAVCSGPTKKFCTEKPNNLPVFLGFGKEPLSDAFRRIIETTIEELLVRGKRVMFQPGSSEQFIKSKTILTSSNFLIVDYEPHRILFPLCSCVVHHAGPEISHVAVLSGCPSVPVPMGYEQMFFAHRLVECGAARTQHRFQDSNSFSLLHAILDTVRDTSLQTAALQRELQRELDQPRAAEAVLRIVERGWTVHSLSSSFVDTLRHCKSLLAALGMLLVLSAFVSWWILHVVSWATATLFRAASAAFAQIGVNLAIRLKAPGFE